LINDESNIMIAQLVGAMQGPDFPTAIGVIYHNPASTYVTELLTQRIHIREKRPAGKVADLLFSGHTWEVG
jgi:2-oxoglutarate/2-oxoacid ferredoxin oxidoreductase subunit beta